MKKSEIIETIREAINEQTAIDLKNQDISANVDKEFYDKLHCENHHGTYKVTTKGIHNNVEIVCVCE